MNNIIKDLAEYSAVPWEIIAEKIDDNFKELEDSISSVNSKETLNKLDLLQYLNNNNYALKQDIPKVPSKVSEFINDSRYITLNDIPVVDLSLYAKLSDIPSLQGYAKLSDIPKDYLTQIPPEYITEEELNSKGYLLHLSLSDYAKKSDIPTDYIKSIPPEYITYNELLNFTYSKISIDNKIANILTDGTLDLDNYYTKLEVDDILKNENIVVDLNNYYTKREVDSKIPDTSKFITSKDVPTRLGLLTNDVLFLTALLCYTKQEVDNLIPKDCLTLIPPEYVTELELNNKGYLTEHQSLSGYAKLSDIPSLEGYAKKSDIPTDYLTSIPDDYVTEAELENKGYLTSSDLSISSNDIRVYNDIGNWYAYVDFGSSSNSLTIFLSNDFEYFDDIKKCLINHNGKISISSVYNNISLTIDPINYEMYRGSCVVNGSVYSENNTFLLNGNAIFYIDDSLIRISVSKDSYHVNELMFVTHSLLKKLVKYNALSPGRRYAITDYSCIYKQPVTNIVIFGATSDIKYIICTAISTNTLSDNVEVVREEGYVPIVECKYSIDPDVCEWTTGITSHDVPGVIWYMKDANGNECNYDFKHILFRRYAVNDITPNMETDTGTGGTAGPFKVNMTTSAYFWGTSQELHRIGSGETTDKTMITSIFSGKWAASTLDLSYIYATNTTLKSFHSDYQLQCHKPYNNTAYSRDKYLSWTSDMRNTEGISPASSKNSCSVYGMSNVTINTNSYKNVYTFDYDGEDASELTRAGSELPLVSNVKIDISNAENRKSSLPNTCFMFSDSCINGSDTYLYNIELFSAKHNTFLLRAYATYNYAKIDNLKCLALFTSNLCICLQWTDVICDAPVKFNYFNCDFDKLLLRGLINKNVWFGYIRGTSLGNSQLNLWYNAFRKIKFSDSSSWSNVLEGMHTNYFESNNYLDSNILAPMQYCRFWPHVNCNTFRCVGNRGVELKASSQLNSYGALLWGTTLHYGSGFGIKYGNIIGTNINAKAFKDQSIFLSGNLAHTYFDNSLPKMPDLVDVDIYSVEQNAYTINNMNSSYLLLLSNRSTSSRKTLTYINNDWVLNIS